MKKNNFTPSTSIRFIAFGSEEQGLLGSYDYTVKISNAGDKVRFMLNNDMIAYEPETNKTNWYVDIMDYANSGYLRKEAEMICTRYSVLKPYNDNTYSHASDSYLFFMHGYKALFFFARNIDPNYHTTDDLVTNCNFDYCREIVKVNCAILVSKN
jgi:Zn-dependent M28 family amino/carboxypeptidase